MNLTDDDDDEHEACINHHDRLQRQLEKYREVKRMRMIEKGRRNTKIKDQQIRQSIQLTDETRVSCSSGINCIIPPSSAGENNSKNKLEETYEDSLQQYLHDKRRLSTEAGQDLRGTVLALDIDNAYLINRTSSISNLCKIMALQEIDSVLVIDDDSELCGIVTDKDVLLHCGLARNVADALRSPVQHIMSTNVICGRIEEPIHEILVKMIDNKFRHLPIVDRVDGGVLCSGGPGSDDFQFVTVGMIDMLKIIDYIQSILACSWGKVKCLLRAYDEFQEYWQEDTPPWVRQWFEEWSSALPTLKSLYRLDSDSNSHALVVNCYDSVETVIHMMARQRATAAIVVDQQLQLSGILTSKDLILRVVSAELESDQTPVSAVMTPYPDTADENVHIDEVLTLMSQNNYQHLPITSVLPAAESNSSGKNGTANIVGMADILSLTCFTLAQLIRRGKISRICEDKDCSKPVVASVADPDVIPQTNRTRNRLLTEGASLVLIVAATTFLLVRLATKIK